VTGLLPEAGLQLNPDAAHPPFRWHVALPSEWAILDTHPSSWERSLEGLVDDRLAGQRLKAAERREVLQFLGTLVGDCQRAGAVISLVQIGRLGNGTVGSAGLHVAWYDSSPDRASLALIHQAVGRHGVTAEIDTPAGQALLQRDHVSIAPLGSTTRRGSTTLQVFLPLTASTWTAVVATAAAHPEMVPMLRDLVVTVAGSIRPLDAQPAPSEPTPADDGPGVAYTPTPPPDAPGIERGFGTLILHHIEPERPVSEGR